MVRMKCSECDTTTRTTPSARISLSPTTKANLDYWFMTVPRITHIYAQRTPGMVRNWLKRCRLILSAKSFPRWLRMTTRAAGTNGHFVHCSEAPIAAFITLRSLSFWALFSSNGIAVELWYMIERAIEQIVGRERRGVFRNWRG